MPTNASVASSPQGTKDGPTAVVSSVYARMLAVLLFLFLLFSDWVLLGGPLLVVRRTLVVVLPLAAVPFVLHHFRTTLLTLRVPPLIFFAAFLCAGLVLAPAALAPLSATVHTLAFAGLMLFAVAVVATVPLATTLALVRLTLALKLVGSLAVGILGARVASPGLLGSVPGTLAQRHTFGGLFGNPNPLCDAAALYLLLVACDLIERGWSWRSGSRERLLAGWYVLTTPIAAYLMWQSLSRSAWLGALLVALLFGLLAQWRASPAAGPRRRRALLLAGSGVAAVVGILALLVWLDVSRGVIHTGGSFAARLRHAVTSGAILDAAERPQFWQFAVERMQERPWTGYGMAATPTLYASRFQGRLEHSHNLELEAALYAGIPAALLIVLFVVSTGRAAVRAFLARHPCALSGGAALFFFLILAQVEPIIFGSPYPNLLIVLILAAQLQHPPSTAGSQPR